MTQKQIKCPACNSDDICEYFVGKENYHKCENCQHRLVKEKPILSTYPERVASEKIVNFLASALKDTHDHLWHWHEGYDETDMFKRNIRALKAAGVAEYCGKWEDDEDGEQGAISN